MEQAQKKQRHMGTHKTLSGSPQHESLMVCTDMLLEWGNEHNSCI